MTKASKQEGDGVEKQYQGGWPTYMVSKEKRKYVVRKFTGFDHSWAEYGKPLEIFDNKSEANKYIDSMGGY